MEPDQRPQVVIVGAGFAGLEAAKILGRSPDVRVTVVDRRNHHLFQPLLYQVATATLDPSDVAAPIRMVLRRNQNTEVVLAEVASIDRASRTLHFTDGGSVGYDHLIVAAGAQDTYFNHPEWECDAPGLKSLEDALEIRRRVLFAFEEAEREEDEAKRRAWMTFVIIGGGPTGVELAGSLSEIAHKALPRDFRRINTRDARVVLIEGLPRLLTTYPPELSEDARRDLQKLQIDVRLGLRVSAIDGEGVTLGDERIQARTVLWGAGVVASPLGRALGVPVDRVGRVAVEPDLTLVGDPRVSVVGDLAAVTQDGKPVPGIAPAAMQMGREAARNVLRRIHGEPVRPFRYLDRGIFAVIGRGSAVGTLFGRWDLSGIVAWFVWATVHLRYVVGFRSRTAVFFTWLYSFLTWRPIARLITFTPWLQQRERAVHPQGASPPMPASASLPAAPATPVPVHAASDR
ncbi:MAG TPA: NAD(P)/FAD-dependent oxidoreductase [Myxococcaceae bacterium]|nr:NAD(P)/FAD-dependent oxidoreductase [Myxococcaceae bacterium]